MKALPGNISRPLPVGAFIDCADNTGAKKLQIITVPKFKSKRRTLPSAGIACYIKCRVYKGEQKVKYQVHNAVIIRQKKPWRRPDGLRVGCEDNAAVLVDEKGVPKGTLIKGPVAREAVDRFPGIGKLATMVF